MIRSKTMIPGIVSAGYDALCAVLELEFFPDGDIWQFYDVPEQVWYEWRSSRETVIYFHLHILGKYAARQIMPET